MDEPIENRWVLGDLAGDCPDLLTQNGAFYGRHEMQTAWCKVLAELEKLGQQKCLACSGFGHSKGLCPTKERLDDLAASDTYSR